MVITAEPIIKEPPILDETIFRAGFEDMQSISGRDSHSIRLDRDSYIILFDGRRGGGKTTAMTVCVIKAVALYNMKVISNFPIEFMLRRYRPDGKSYLQHVEAEPLDFEKLICFDEEYKHVLICIDEAPDIISHMASQTWRNRLVAAFTRQIRKNFNTLFLAAQDFELIDKSMRWQVDIIVECRDAARYLGDNNGLERGEMLFLNWYDNSGQWTGQSTEDRLRLHLNPRVLQKKLFPRILWGDDTHNAVFDSWHQIDILDGLRKVDIKLSSIQIRDKDEDAGRERYPVNIDILNSALKTIEMVWEKNPENPITLQPLFYKSLGRVTKADKSNLGNLLSMFNVGRGRDGNTGSYLYDFSGFDLDGFRSYVMSVGG